jgi:hypothetical protein
MKSGIYLIAAFALLATPALAAPVNLTPYGALTGTEIVTFNELAGGPHPGTNINSLLVSHGVSLGERFAGQTVSFSGTCFCVAPLPPNIVDHDQLGGAPAGGALTLLAGATDRNLNVTSFVNLSTILFGVGHVGYPGTGAIGEGAVSVLFLSGQSEFGFQVVGGNGGSAFLSFFRADGSLISDITLNGLANGFYGFSREGGVNDIFDLEC